MVIGTLDYMAPEQLAGKPVDARSDVYALGCVLFETLTGRVPYPAKSAVAKMYAHGNEPVPSLGEVAPDLPTELDPMIQRAMAKDPAARFLSAGDLGRAASDASVGAAPRLTEQAVATGDAAFATAPTREVTRRGEPAVPEPTARRPEPPPAPPRTATYKRRRPRLAALLAVAAVIAGGGVAVALLVGGGGDGDRSSEGGDETAAGVAAPAGTVTDTSAVPGAEPAEPEAKPVVEEAEPAPEEAFPAIEQCLRDFGWGEFKTRGNQPVLDAARSPGGIHPEGPLHQDTHFVYTADFPGSAES